MILEEDQAAGRIANLKKQIEVQKRLIEMSEPFEMLRDNSYFKKIQGYYKSSADIYQDKINSLTNDLVNDGVGQIPGELPENPALRHLRIADLISKCVVARDTLISFSSEGSQIIEAAKQAVERIESLTKEIQDLEEPNNATRG